MSTITTSTDDTSVVEVVMAVPSSSDEEEPGELGIVSTTSDDWPSLNDESSWEVASLISDATAQNISNEWDWVAPAASSDDVLSLPSDVSSLAITEENPKPNNPPLLSRNKSRRDVKGNQSKKGYDPNVSDAKSDSSFCWDEKPMSDKLRRKYEQAGRRRLLRGHTGRQAKNGHVYLKERSELQLDHDMRSDMETDKDFDFLTALDLLKGEQLATNDTRTQTWNLNKRKGWDVIPTILEEEAVATSHGKSEQRPVSTYTLQVVSIKAKAKGSKEEMMMQREAERRARTIYHIPAGNPSFGTPQWTPKLVFAELSIHPPANVKGELLSWTLRQQPLRKAGGKRANRKRITFGKNNMPKLHARTAYCIQDAPFLAGGDKRSYIELDLGQPRHVTSVSTQGAPPPVRRYPGRLEKWEDKRHYKGPFWNVYDPNCSTNIHHSPALLATMDCPGSDPTN